MRPNAELVRRFKILTLLTIRIEKEFPKKVAKTVSGVTDQIASMIDNKDFKLAEKGLFLLEDMVISYFESTIASK